MLESTDDFLLEETISSIILKSLGEKPLQVIKKRLAEKYGISLYQAVNQHYEKLSDILRENFAEGAANIEKQFLAAIINSQKQTTNESKEKVIADPQLVRQIMEDFGDAGMVSIINAAIKKPNLVLEILKSKSCNPPQTLDYRKINKPADDGLLKSLDKSNSNSHTAKLKSYKFLLLSLLAVVAAYLSRSLFTSEQFIWISGPVYAIGAGLATILAFVVVIKYKSLNTDYGKAMLMFAIANSCWFIAEQIWLLYEVLGVDPFPSEADFFYLAAYPFYIAFVLYYVLPIKKFITNKVIIFSTIISVAFLVPSLLATYNLNFEESNYLEIAIALAYPLADSFLLATCIIGIIYFFRGTRNYFWGLILIGFLLTFIADTIFLYMIVDDSYYDGHPVDILWAATYVLFIFALNDYIKRARSYEEQDNATIVGSIRIETINRLIIPLTFLTIVTVSILTIIFFNYYSFEERQDYTGISIGIFAIIGVFSVMTFLLVGNLRKLIMLHTSEVGEQQNELREMDRRKEEFTSMIAHELKTPLMPILGWCNVLKKNQVVGKLTPEQSLAVDKILSNTRNLITLVNDLLDAQKLDLKKIKFSYENIDVVYLLDSLISNISNTAKQKNVEIVNSSEQNFVIESDRNRLEQVLNNLIYNAIDFVPKFTGRIEINATKNHSAAIFYVKDNGPGIEPTKHKDIFKKFYQTDTSATRKHGGSGLGLSICQGIVEGLGGKIWVESEVGKGTTFYFKIPLSSKHI
ncbi:MAG: hypothetical protein FJ356_00870 [Thaumarchaeota archaeon]|nr:hypothetical protein [Nitrososphaerota archaeon]